MAKSSKWRRKVQQGLWMAALLVAIVLGAPDRAIQAFLYAIVLFGAWEWARVSGIVAPNARGAYAVAVLAAAGYLSWTLRDDPMPPGLVHAFSVVWLVPLAFVLACEGTRRPIPPGRALPYRVPAPVVAAAGFLVLGPFAIVQQRIVGELLHGHLWLLLGLGLVAVVDTLGQVVGRHGRRRLVPVVSPRKTWEGLLAGLVGAALVGALAGVFNRLGPGRGALLGLVVGAASVVGDLTASLAKRNVPTKDFSALLGQHGGVMDRVDGHLAAAPVLGSLLIWLGGGGLVL